MMTCVVYYIFFLSLTYSYSASLLIVVPVTIMYTSYTCSGFCKTSYHLFISPPPTNHQNTIKFHTGENKIERYSRMCRQYTCFFYAFFRQIQMFLNLKPSQSPGESSLKISARSGSPFRRS